MTKRMALAAILVGTVLASVYDADPTLTMGCTFILFCLTFVAMNVWRAGRRHLFSPLVLMLSYMGIGLGVKGLLNLYSLESKIAGGFDPTAALSRQLLFEVFLYGLIGAVSFVIGDAAGGRLQTRRELQRPVGFISGRRIAAVLWFGTSLTIVAGCFLISRLGTNVIFQPSMGALLDIAGLFWLFPLLFAGIYAWALAVINDWVVWGYARKRHILGLVAVVVFVFLLTSSKASLLTAVVIVIAGRHYCLRPLRWRVLVALALVFLVLLPVLYMHRAYGLNVRFLEHFQPQMLVTGLMLFLNRSYLADSLSAILLYTPTLFDYQYGRPWLELFYFWIPRGLWPDKPLSAGFRFGETYFSSNPEAGKSFFTIGLIGDGYVNFGAVGIVVLMAGLGFVLRLFYDRLIGNRPRAWGIFLYAAAVYPIAVSSEQTLATFFSLAASYLTIATLITFCAYSRMLGHAPATAYQGLEREKG